ncbi:MAG: hypothetical protein J6U20_10840 [Fibrobacter sp.]|nr:hypothetical protein [Fibrobacter sp.]
MTKLLKILSLLTVMVVSSALFCACTDSDNLVFDDDNTNPISVSAFMARSFDSTAIRVKSDTIIHGDSLLFIANILPSKSIRIRDSYWLMDNKFYASEFNIHDAISLPGEHEIVFVLITYFGDTLTDTLHLWISSPPILDNKKYIPANGSQNIPPQEDMQFAWSAYDIDSLCTLHYHFVLTNLLDEEKSEPDLVDTIVDTPYFNMSRALKPLSQYRWTVQAINEYNVASTTTITSTFTTSGVGDEGAIAGMLRMSSENLYTDIDLIVTSKDDKKNIIKQSIEKTPTTGMFEVKPLAPGKYTITAQCKKGKDYVSNTMQAEVRAGQVTFVGTLYMADKKAPTIRSEAGTDTLDFADSLNFIITDGGAENSIANTTVYIGNRKVSQYITEGQKLIVPTIEGDRTWIPQLITIITTDGSGNSATKSFVLRPSILWFDTNNDTTISRQSQITIFIKDHNPFSFKPSSFKINPNNDVKGTITLEAEGNSSIDFVMSGDAFSGNEHEIVTTVFYMNGVSQSRSWKLKINEPPFMSFERNCIFPCDEYTAPATIFRWEDAEDPEKDSLLYRLNVVLGSDTVTDTTLFYYRSSFVRTTSLVLRGIPEGLLFWWVEAKDPYGGNSNVWRRKAAAYVLSESDYEKYLNGEFDNNLENQE